MKFDGTLSKMVSYPDLPVKYRLMLGEVQFDITKLIGAQVKLKYSGQIICGHCGKKTKKSYSQGYWNVVINNKNIGLLGAVSSDDQGHGAGFILFLRLEQLKNAQFQKLLRMSKQNPHIMY